MLTRNLFFLSLSALLLFACTSKEEQTKIDQLALDKAQKKNVLKNFLVHSNSITDTKIKSLIETLHSDSSLIWSDGKTLNNSALRLRNITANSIKYGLDSSFYLTQKLRKLYNSSISDTGNIDVLAEGELEFSKAAIQFFTQVKYGFLNHEEKDSVYFQWKFDSLTTQDIETIRNGIISNELDKVIDTLEPQFIGYKTLRKSWGNFVENKAFGFEKVSVHSMKEDSTKSYKKAKLALLTSNFIDSNELENDSIFIERLKQFQIHHGLKPDARVGRASAYALSRSNADRRLSVMTSLEKLKWEKFEDDSLLYVNIPSYLLRVIEYNEIKQEYRAVVGKTINRTPTFSADMKYLILNPFWHIPYSISSKEILPKLKRDSNLVKKKGYTIYDKNRNRIDASKVDWSKVSSNSFNYKISQTRSGGTALGRVKFIFTNKYSIYFHDTPSKSLFKNDIRAYSHGCVRIKDPLNLATYLMSRVNPAYTQDSVENFVKRGIQKRIDLDYPLRVSIRYFSCEGTEEGNVIFYRDIYKKETEIKSVIQDLIYSKSE